MQGSPLNIRPAWLAGVALVALLGLQACGPEPPSQVGAITPAELADRLAAGQAPVILDVRTVAEYDEAHIPGALDLPR